MLYSKISNLYINVDYCNENKYNFQLKENAIKNIIGRWKSNLLRFTKYNTIEKRYNKNKELILWEYNNSEIFTSKKRPYIL